MARLAERSLTFEKKWTSYALAGGAALALPSLAQAATITLSTEDGFASAPLDVDGDGTPDFTFSVDATDSDERITSVNGTTPSNLIFGYFDAPFPRSIATAFGPGEVIEGSTVPGGVLLADDKIKGGLKGEWPNDLSQFRFLGLQFVTAGVTYTGWAEVAVELGSASLTVDRFGFGPATGPVTTPGTTVPEPGSMGLLLLGAAGVAALKRRRA
jgi:hypothetical protein